MKKTVLSFAAFLLLPAGLEAQEWTRFRGPGGTGVSEATTIPVRWTEDDYNWKVEIPGIGHSQPVLWGERPFPAGPLGGEDLPNQRRGEGSPAPRHLPAGIRRESTVDQAL